MGSETDKTWLLGLRGKGGHRYNKQSASSEIQKYRGVECSS